MPPPPSQPAPDIETLLAHSPYVRRLARELVFDAALARDVEQETWLAALGQAPRDPRALRGWLAALVRNIAFKAWRSAARRRTRELVHAQVERAALTPAEVLEREDLRRKLVEVVNALDEPYRSVLVLRYLEGLEPDEVARRLAVPLETVRTRIKRGLELLRARLDRASHGDRGAWCLLLVRGFRLGPPGPGKLALTLLSSSLTGSSGVLAMGLLVLSGTLFFLWHPGEPVEPSRTRAEPVASASPHPSMDPEPIEPLTALAAERISIAASDPAPAPAAAGDDVIEIAGRVLDPDGKPVAGADVYLTRWHWDERYPHDPIASTRADAAGRFALSYSRSDPRFAVDVERPEMWRQVIVSAFAPGFGPGWQERKKVPAGEEAVLTLVRDVPLRGRVLDLDGQPVAGARIGVLYIQAVPEPESLDAFLEDPAGKAALLSRSLQPPPAREIACETRADGVFELRGIGRERYVSLDVRGSTITQAFVRAVTRPIETITWSAGDMMAMNETLHGSELDWVARPTRPVTGVVRDAASGKALAGVRVISYSMAGMPFVTLAVETTTDAGGRFRLLGMPKGAGNELLVVPGDEQPYFMRQVPVPDPAGMAPVEVDVELHQGLWISGRVTDRASGKPAHGRIHYLPFLDNPHARELPEFDPYSVHGGIAYQSRYRTDADGRFRIVALPGRAIVGVVSIGAWRQGAGAEAIEGANEDGEFLTFSNPVAASRSWPTSMRAIDIAVDASTTVCDLELDRGASLTLELVDPEEQPLEHCKVTGSAGGASFQRADDVGPRLEVINLGQDERRLLRIHHEETDLGLAAFVSLRDASAGKQRLMLRPCATIVGRLLDQGGAPVADTIVQMSTMIDYDEFVEVRTDEDGRFRIEHVAPGVKVHVGAVGPTLDPEEVHVVLPEYEVEAGATKDVGDVRVKVR